MRRFLITAPSYTGEAEIMFDESGRLVRIDVMKTDMQPPVINPFKAMIPADVASLNDALAAKKVTVVEVDFEISLDDFKREYPYSRNYHLLTTRWGKLTKTEQVQAYYAAIEYRKYCKRNDWYKPKIADSWLANKEFLNDWKKM